jgi:hypothetical protein
MSDSSGGLSDALRHLADGTAAAPDAAPAGARGGDDAVAEGELAAEVLGEVDDEAGDVIAAAPGLAPAPAAPKLTTAERRAAIRAAQLKQQKHPAKMVLIVALFVVGTLLLVPACWSIGAVCGMWSTDMPDSRMKGAFMLVCWPLAAVLLAGAALLLKQFRRVAP